MKNLRISFSDISYMSGEVLYSFNGKSVNSGAFPLGGISEVKIRLPRAVGVSSAFINIYSENMALFTSLQADIVLKDTETDEFTFKIKLPVGLYFFSFTLFTPAGKIFGRKDSSTRMRLVENESGEHFQLTVCDFKHDAPDFAKGGIIYHVFVDRFNKGNHDLKPKDYAVMIDDWDNGIPEYPEYPGAPLKNNTFFGGDLYGVIDKLDYISELGVTLIYLSPVFEAYSNHKYDTADYMRVDSMFGSDEALEKLISEAKKRGIGIILDGVFNHTGSDSIYFNKNGRYSELGAYQSRDSEYYSWYDFKEHPNKYTCWWDIEILPRINPNVPECANYFVGDGGVIEKYAKMGIAGMRLDVADELSDDFIAKIKIKLSAYSSQNLLYGEVWEDASNKIAYDQRKRYYLGEELDGVMNYPLRTGIISYLKNKSTNELNYALTDVIFNSPKRIRDMQMNLLGTHDTERIITVLAGESHEGKRNCELAYVKMTEEEKLRGIALLKMAYTILATVPGLPTVFYGDEAGLEGYKDPFNRRPFPWNNINTEILDHYKKIGSIRKNNPVYKDGEFSLLWLDKDSLVFERYSENERLFTVVNNCEKAITVKCGGDLIDLDNDRCGRTHVLDPLCAKILKSPSNNKVKIHII